MTENQSIDPKLSAELHALHSMPERDPQAIAHGRAQYLAQAEELAAELGE